MKLEALDSAAWFYKRGGHEFQFTGFTVVHVQICIS
jgi:hypothetical protein